jgi:hypothetical protein
MQAKTAVRWHVRPPSEAKSVVEEGHGPMKEENLLLVSCEPAVFERNRTHEEHILLQMERKRAFRQGVRPLAEAICFRCFPNCFIAFMVSGTGSHELGAFSISTESTKSHYVN